MRQLNLSLDELLNADGQYRSCLIANEIGEIAKQTKDPKAVKALCAMLSDGDPSARYAAYGHLSVNLSGQPGVKEAIATFEANIENAEIVATFHERFAVATSNTIH
jgi:hypothetical protein